MLDSDVGFQGRTTKVECGGCGSTIGVAYIDDGAVYFGRVRKIDKRTMQRRGLKSRRQIQTPTEREHSFDVPCLSCRNWITINLKHLRARLEHGAVVGRGKQLNAGEPFLADETGPETILVWAQNGGTFPIDPRYTYTTAS